MIISSAVVTFVSEAVARYSIPANTSRGSRNTNFINFIPFKDLYISMIMSMLLHTFNYALAYIYISTLDTFHLNSHSDTLDAVARIAANSSSWVPTLLLGCHLLTDSQANAYFRRKLDNWWEDQEVRGKWRRLGRWLAVGRAVAPAGGQEEEMVQLDVLQLRGQLGDDHMRGQPQGEATDAELRNDNLTLDDIHLDMISEVINDPEDCELTDQLDDISLKDQLEIGPKHIFVKPAVKAAWLPPEADQSGSHQVKKTSGPRVTLVRPAWGGRGQEDVEEVSSV
jgi:hypothetical protein